MAVFKQKIKNPLTNRLVLLTSSKGKELIKKYVEKTLSFATEDEEKIVLYLGHGTAKKTKMQPHLPFVPPKLAALLKKYIHRAKRLKSLYSSDELRDFCLNKKPLTSSNIDYQLTVQLNYDIWEWRSQLLDATKWKGQSSFDPKTKKFTGKPFVIDYNLINVDFYLRYLQKTPKPTISIDDLIDPKWFHKMNTFLSTLSNRKRLVVFGYTNNSHFHVNPFLFEKDYDMKRFYKWYVSNGHRVNPFFYQLLDAVTTRPFADLLTDETKDDGSRFLILSCRDTTVLMSQKYQMIHDLCMKRRFRLDVIRHAFTAFISELQEIIYESPPLEKDMILYRGTRTDYFLTGSKNRTYKNSSFLSCTISSQHAVLYMVSLKCCLHRLLVPKGTHVLFVGGNTVYKNELEFVLPAGCLYTNIETSHTSGKALEAVTLCPKAIKSVQITDTVIYCDKQV